MIVTARITSSTREASCCIWLAEDLPPLLKPLVRGQHRRGPLVAARHQPEEQHGAVTRDWEVADLVDDQQRRMGEHLQPLQQVAARRARRGAVCRRPKRDLPSPLTISQIPRSWPGRLSQIPRRAFPRPSSPLPKSLAPRSQIPRTFSQIPRTNPYLSRCFASLCKGGLKE